MSLADKGKQQIRFRKKEYISFLVSVKNYILKTGLGTYLWKTSLTMYLRGPTFTHTHPCHDITYYILFNIYIIFIFNIVHALASFHWKGDKDNATHFININIYIYIKGANLLKFN